MNRYDSLKKLYSDIEVLESAGLYKAANVLHKKFVKEAQAQGAFGGIVTQDAKNFMMELDKAYNSGQPTLGVIQKAERAGLPPQELQALKNHANKIRTQANTDFNSQYPSSGYSTPQDNTGPQGTPYRDYETEVTKGQQFIQGLGNAARQQQTNNQAQPAAQADIVMKGYGDALESGKNNMDIQAKYRMTPQENAAENQLYTSTINEIKKLLTGNQQQRNYARGLYESTRSKFKNQKRQYLFDQQYAAIDRNPTKKQ